MLTIHDEARVRGLYYGHPIDEHGRLMLRPLSSLTEDELEYLGKKVWPDRSREWYVQHIGAIVKSVAIHKIILDHLYEMGICLPYKGIDLITSKIAVI